MRGDARREAAVGRSRQNTKKAYGEGHLKHGEQSSRSEVDRDGLGMDVLCRARFGRT
jgi:hypothetical protein